MPVTARRSTAPRPIALLLPGQGAQHPRMAVGLYRRDPVFTSTVDNVLSLMGEEGRRVRADWLGNAPHIGVDDVRRAQPLLFAVDYALARMVLGWGVRPTALLGHSAGELVAAVLAGVVRLSDAVAMVRDRVREVAKLPAGGMLAVGAPADRLRPYLRDEVAVAAVNANAQTMLAGPTAPLRTVAAALRADDFTVLPVPATHPFHSPAMRPASRAVAAAGAGLRLRPPTVPLYSGFTGERMTDRDARDPRFWADQLTDIVRFGPALDRLLTERDLFLVEVGPRQTLTAFARRHRSVRTGASAAVPLLPARPGSAADDRAAVLEAVTQLAAEGHDVDPDAVAGDWRPPRRSAVAARKTITGTWHPAPLAPPASEAPGEDRGRPTDSGNRRRVA